MDKRSIELIRRRAEQRCEYCHFPDPPFHIEHVIARKHGGATSEENLALACIRCNMHKGSNLSGIDLESGAVVELFNPRVHEWSRHFQWQRGRIIGLTACARASIAVLQMNQSWRIQAREELMREGRFPLP